MFSFVQVDDLVAVPFSTRDPSTGNSADADSLPTAVVEDETGANVAGTDIAVSKKAATTGQYYVTLTATSAQGFAKGQKYTVRVTATVGGVTDQAPIGGFEVSAEQVGNAIDTVLSTIPGSVWDEVLSGAAHNIPQSSGRRLRTLQDFGVYDLASAWVDVDNGTSTGTTDFEDATVTNRADNFENAKTVALSVGLDSIHIQNGNSITLASSVQDFNIGGFGGLWTLNLNNQDITEASISGAEVTGTGTGPNAAFYNCKMNNATVPPSQFRFSAFPSTFTMASVGDYLFANCYSLVPGSGSPTFDLNSIGSVTVSFRGWSGGMTLVNVTALDVISIDAVSGGTITINGTGGTVHVRGMVAVNDLSGGSVTVVKTQVVSPSEVWAYTEAIAGTRDAFEIICMAAAGIGANALSSVAQPSGTPLTFDTTDYRVDTFTYPDGTTTAFTIEADSQGLRQNLTLP